MAAAHKSPHLRVLPVLHGMLRANGEMIEGPRPSDQFDVFVDDEGDLVVMMVDVHCSSEPTGNFLGPLMRHARAALQTHEAIHTVVSELEVQLAVRPGVEAGLSILRFSQREARVEVLNAGMPAIANVLPGGHVEMHAALSSPLGRRVGEVHAYELVPLVWGSTWLAVSDGMTGGALDADSVSKLSAQLELAEHGLALTGSTGEAFYAQLQGVLPSARFVRDDATCVLIGADPGARFQSGIDSH